MHVLPFCGSRLVLVDSIYSTLYPDSSQTKEVSTSSGQQLRIQLQLSLDKALLPSLFVGFFCSPWNYGCIILAKFSLSFSCSVSRLCQSEEAACTLAFSRSIPICGLSAAQLSCWVSDSHSSGIAGKFSEDQCVPLGSGCFVSNPSGRFQLSGLSLLAKILALANPFVYLCSLEVFTPPRLESRE